MDMYIYIDIPMFLYVCVFKCLCVYVLCFFKTYIIKKLTEFIFKYFYFNINILCFPEIFYIFFRTSSRIRTCVVLQLMTFMLA